MSARTLVTRLQWPALVVVCAAGVLVSIMLAVSEAGDEPPIEVIETTDEIEGTTITASAVVENNTDERRCPEIRIAARDRNTRDLAEVVAEPVTGDGAIPPGARMGYEAVIEDLSEQEIAEDLDDVSAYVARDEVCP